LLKVLHAIRYRCKGCCGYKGVGGSGIEKFEAPVADRDAIGETYHLAGRMGAGALDVGEIVFRCYW
jgi:hypothetical protein